MAGFNCNLRKKRTFELTLPDEKETVVLIKSPSKDTVTALFEIFPKFSNLGKNPDAKTMAGVSEDAYDLGVDIINNNQ
ncbi:MAG: hypothetical protein MR413_08780, partial [Clostridia bacterium]|nr:hypothetical protein [Clostridia bacterium]